MYYLCKNRIHNEECLSQNYWHTIKFRDLYNKRELNKLSSFFGFASTPRADLLLFPR